jgi:hypothetical protein
MPAIWLTGAGPVSSEHLQNDVRRVTEGAICLDPSISHSTAIRCVGIHKYHKLAVHAKEAGIAPVMTLDILQVSLDLGSCGVAERLIFVVD